MPAAGNCFALSGASYSLGAGPPAQVFRAYPANRSAEAGRMKLNARRLTLAGLLAWAAVGAAGMIRTAAASQTSVPSPGAAMERAARGEMLPRKVIIGTAVQGFW